MNHLLKASIERNQDDMKMEPFEKHCADIAKKNQIDYSGNLFATLDEEVKFYKEVSELYARECCKEAIRLARENLSFSIGSTLPLTNQEILDQLFKLKA